MERLKFKCSKCGNEDINSIGFRNGKPYCRKCIGFREGEKIINDAYPKVCNAFLNYSLSNEQKELSDRLISNYKRGIDSLVFAVCGSGKTEISLGVISYAVRCGEKVAFAVPRKDVVIELFDRLKKIFKYNRVISLYGGHHDKLNGDIIVLTTHQIYRYYKFFSLVIIDEIDAFPFKGNELLMNMVKNSLNGHYIFMSATPPKNIVQEFEKDKNKAILHLDTRFHRHPLPVPKIIKTNSIFKYLFLIKKLKKFTKENHQVFVFCPTIEECEIIFKIVSLFCKKGTFVHSKCRDRSKKIEDFKKEKYKFLITTSVLERGVTVKGLQVIVFNSDHALYDEGALIQIAGRAGRKKEDPTGEVIFISETVSEEMESAIKSIQRSNEALQNML